MTKCRLCGSESKKHFLLPHATTWRCGALDCGLEFADPQLDEAALARAYSDLYYPVSGNFSEIQFENTPDHVLRQFFQNLQERIGSLQGLSLLDYGCGRGALLRISLEFGMRPVGIEQDAQARATALNDSGARVHKSVDALELVDPDPQFDLVILWTVIEHLRDPWAQVARLRPFLRRSGWLLVSTMDIRCLRARIEGPRWENYRNPTHLFYFDRVSLARAIQEAGFEEFSEWKPKIAYPHHGTLRRWLHGVTSILGLADGLYYLCKGCSESDGRASARPVRRQISSVAVGGGLKASEVAGFRRTAKRK
jgi:2-polyprenyl-3-methyl-5-hydroxy-6-metoxy-1,4-benzoquinol methylase